MVNDWVGKQVVIDITDEGGGMQECGKLLSFDSKTVTLEITVAREMIEAVGVSRHG